jgi:outer membrane protein OmpA-like peptidoglycan-associated protein/tetratricopeptide (TPR) repeat protein
MNRNQNLKTLILSFIILCFLPNALLPQAMTNKVYIKGVQDADMFFYFSEDFEKAASIYEALLKDYPDNSNLSAKLGICYLNIDGKKADALKLLRKASGNVVKSDIEYVEYGLKAPLDTWYYLAHAYLINDSLEKAIILYTDVKRKIGSTEVFKLDYLDNQIKACKYAVEMENNPVDVTAELLMPWLKDYPGATNPVLSQNDSVFVFTRKESGKNHIYCSLRNNGWPKPFDITAQLDGFDNMCSNSITARGDLLIIYMDDGADGNLFSSSRKGTVWSKVKKLNKNINTKYWEASGFITPNGKQLYFSSNRTEGIGELDIWVSQSDGNGNWGPATNLGNVINTPYNENSPFFNPATGTLIFSSFGHSGMGGYDIFSSNLKIGKWTKPIGLPYPVNTTSDNIMFLEDHEGKGYITSMVEDHSGIRNIYRIVQYGPSAIKILVKGSVILQDGNNIAPRLADVQVTHADSTSWKKLELNDSGMYRFVTRPGNYIVQVKYAGYKTDTASLSIPKSFTGNYLSISTLMIPDRVSSGDFLAIRSILFDFNSANLNEQATIELEKLNLILKNYPDFQIEVSGYTDIIGTKAYNMQLADTRAQSVVSFLTGSGISESRFKKRAFGASDFVAINTNPDGSDNPEGRQYNRRVSIGIINPQTGVTIRQESFTPPGLRLTKSMRYNIVLLKSSEKFSPDYFKDFRMNELFFVRPIFIDSEYLYVLGTFTNRSDAESYLKFAKEKGFNNAYVVNQFDMQNPPRQIKEAPENNAIVREGKIYVIQLKATSNPLDMNIFKGIENVKEVKGNDGYYRYFFGEFKGFTRASAALESLLSKSDYKDAFIKEYDLLIKQ